MEKFFSDKAVAYTGKFILGIAVLFLLFSFLLSLIPLQNVEFFYAFLSLSTLKLFGFSGTIEVQEPVLIFLTGFSAPIGISYLCTGLLEMAIIASAIFASFGVGLKKRIWGAALALVVIALFNLIRIVASVLIIAYLGLGIGNFSHDLLFRIFLFVTIAGYYFLWFNFGSKKSHERFKK